MGYALKWFIEGRVLECTVTDEVTLDDVKNIRQDFVQDYLHQANPPALHALIDISTLRKSGFKVADFLEIPTVGEHPGVDITDETFGWRLYFGSDEVIFRFAMTIFHETHGHTARWFASREAALKFLCAEDASLGC